MALDAYFERIGWRGPREPTLNVLTELCPLHTSTFPFENLDILLGRGIALDLPSLLEKFVTRQRGGYCFEHNALMLAALGPGESATSPRHAERDLREGTADRVEGRHHGLEVDAGTRGDQCDAFVDEVRVSRPPHFTKNGTGSHQTVDILFVSPRTRNR